MRISFHFPSHSLYLYRSSSNCALAFDAYMRHFVSFAGESVSLCFVHEAPTYSILSHSHISQQKRSLYILFLSLSSIHSISLFLPWNKKLFSFFLSILFYIVMFSSFILRECYCTSNTPGLWIVNGRVCNMNPFRIWKRYSQIVSSFSTRFAFMHIASNVVPSANIFRHLCYNNFFLYVVSLSLSLSLSMSLYVCVSIVSSVCWHGIYSLYVRALFSALSLSLSLFWFFVWLRYIVCNRFLYRSIDTKLTPKHTKTY